MDDWQDLVERIQNPKDEITIHFVGKYVEYEDSYKSINEALFHGGFQHRAEGQAQVHRGRGARGAGRPAPARGRGRHPGGAGVRRPRQPRHDGGGRVRPDPTHPLLRHLLRLPVGRRRVRAERRRPRRAPTRPKSSRTPPHKVIYKLRDLLGVDDMGGTMRLGSYACRLAPDSLAFKLYGEEIIHERHRHRYEFNCLYEKTLTEHGLRIVGRSLDGKFVEIVELPGPPVVPRGAVPSGVQVEAAAPASAVRRLRRSGLQAEAWRCRASRRTSRRSAIAGRAEAGRPIIDRCDRRCSAPVREVRIADGVVLGRAGLVLIAGPCVIESEEHARRARRAPSPTIARRAGVPLHLQGVVRQSEPHVARRRFAGPGIDEGLAVLGRVRRRGRRAGPDRHPRALAGGRRRPRSPTCCRFRRSSRGRPT